jgi:hypothetical protein
MRDFKGMKRQRGRNRGGGNTGGKPQHNANRAFDSSGPEGVKVRGAAQGVFEKYQQLSRDAASAGDRVLAENYLQHAEHYFRTLRAMQPHRPVSDIVGREQFASGFDIDFEAEPEDAPEPSAETEAADGDNDGQNQNGQRFENRQRDRDDRPRDRDRDQGGQRNFEGRQRDRDDRPRNNDQPPRNDQPRDDRPRDDRQRNNDPRNAEQPRTDQPREERAEGGRRDRWRERDERRERQERAAAEAPRDPLAVVEPQAAAPLAPETPAADSPRLRGQDGAVSELPAFLGRSATPPPAEETPAAEAKKPRRRRAPRTFDGGEGAPAETEEA